MRIEKQEIRFTLDYGNRTVLIEMDDRDNDGDAHAHALLDGDELTVYGRIDGDCYEKEER